VFRAITALALASTTAQSPSTLTSRAPWWEKVTVTVTDDGQTESCRYESSLQPQAGKECSVSGGDLTPTKASSGPSAKDQVTRITFERRFNPGGQPDMVLQPGETLLGGQMMALAIDGHGAVKGCHVVATSGSVTPQYGCTEAEAERFDGGATAANAPNREGYMTILVYGHSEHVV
jgi:hypothetical protein